MAKKVESKDESKLVGPTAVDVGHALGILHILNRAQSISEIKWKGKVPKNRVIDSFQRQVREKVRKGELKPEVLELYNIPPEDELG